AALLPTLRVGRRERVAALPAREPLRGSQWVECRCRRSSRFAPLNSESWFSPIEFIATSEPVPDTRTRLWRRGRVTKSAPYRVHCLVITMLPIIHPHPPNRKTTRKHKTTKPAPPQQHSTFTKTPPCTTHENNTTPTEYRNPLTHNNIQKHPKRAPQHPTQTPRPHPKTPAPHTPPTTTPGTCHHRRSTPKTPNPPTPTKHTPHRHPPPNTNRGGVITAVQHHKTSTPPTHRERETRRSTYANTAINPTITARMTPPRIKSSTYQPRHTLQLHNGVGCACQTVNDGRNLVHSRRTETRPRRCIHCAALSALTDGNVSIPVFLSR
ncbi:hypothetical protein GA0061093_12194, partial [Rhodococcus qingshengii]